MFKEQIQKESDPEKSREKDPDLPVQRNTVLNRHLRNVI
jgi:hypothetical protein